MLANDIACSQVLRHPQLATEREFPFILLFTFKLMGWNLQAIFFWSFELGAIVVWKED